MAPLVYNCIGYIQLCSQAKSCYASEQKRFGNERDRLATRLGHLIIVMNLFGYVLRLAPYLCTPVGSLIVYCCV